MPLLELIHRSSVIEQSQFHTAQQVFQIKNTFVRKNAAYSIRRLSTLVQPIKRLLAIELN